MLKLRLQCVDFWAAIADLRHVLKKGWARETTWSTGCAVGVFHVFLLLTVPCKVDSITTVLEKMQLEHEGRWLTQPRFHRGYTVELAFKHQLDRDR